MIFGLVYKDLGKRGYSSFVPESSFPIFSMIRSPLKAFVLFFKNYSCVASPPPFQATTIMIVLCFTQRSYIVGLNNPKVFLSIYSCRKLFGPH